LELGLSEREIRGLLRGKPGKRITEFGRAVRDLHGTSRRRMSRSARQALRDGKAGHDGESHHCADLLGIGHWRSATLMFLTDSLRNSDHNYKNQIEFK
jgi:hypothetical protein